MTVRHKAVVVIVVDLVDFDGSFPRAIMDVITDSGAEVVLVITKVDLVPRYAGYCPGFMLMPSSGPNKMRIWFPGRRRWTAWSAGCGTAPRLAGSSLPQPCTSSPTLAGSACR